MKSADFPSVAAYYVGTAGLALVLGWFGVFNFFPIEVSTCVMTLCWPLFLVGNVRRMAGFALVLLAADNATAQPGSPAAAPTPYTATAAYDSYFGLYPTLSRTFVADSLREASLYGSYYAQSGYETLELGGTYTWRRPALGLRGTAAAGVLNGSFFAADQGFIAGEGFSAALAAEKEWPRFAVAAAAGYYGLLRQPTDAIFDLAYYHLEVGWKAHPRLTVGALHEQLLDVRRPRNAPDSVATRLLRLGAFGKAELPGQLELELAGGCWPSGFVRASLSRALGRRPARAKPP